MVYIQYSQFGGGAIPETERVKAASNVCALCDMCAEGCPWDEARRQASLEKLREDMREGGGRGEKVVMDMNNKTPEQDADSDDDDDDDDDDDA